MNKILSNHNNIIHKYFSFWHCVKMMQTPNSIKCVKLSKNPDTPSDNDSTFTGSSINPNYIEENLSKKDPRNMTDPKCSSNTSKKFNQKNDNPSSDNSKKEIPKSLYSPIHDSSKTDRKKKGNSLETNQQKNVSKNEDTMIDKIPSEDELKTGDFDFSDTKNYKEKNKESKSTYVLSHYNDLLEEFEKIHFGNNKESILLDNLPSKSNKKRN